MICYLLAMGKQHLGPHVVVGYGIKIFWPDLFITSPDHLVSLIDLCKFFTFLNACISVKTSPIKTKLGNFVSRGMLFLNMWINSC